MLDAGDHMARRLAPSTERTVESQPELRADDSVDGPRGERHVAPPHGYHRRLFVDVPPPDFSRPTWTQPIPAISVSAISPTPSAHWRWTPSKRPIPAIPACPWAWPM